jgi:hypothetical protein
VTKPSAGERIVDRMGKSLDALDNACTEELDEVRAEIRRLEVESEKDEDEWKRIVYYLVDAVHAQRGKSIPEDVEHAKDKIDRLLRDYGALEELSPPDVPRKEFVSWLLTMWEEKHEREAAEAAEVK